MKIIVNLTGTVRKIIVHLKDVYAPIILLWRVFDNNRPCRKQRVGPVAVLGTMGGERHVDMRLHA